MVSIESWHLQIFCGVQFSLIGALQHFAGSLFNFVDAYKHASMCTLKHAYFMGLISQMVNYPWKLDLSKISCYAVLGFIIFLELAEMDMQKEEVWRLEKELSEAEETLENERAKSKGKL